MNENLYDLLLKLPKKNLINLMWNALDEMKTYNGRNKTYCICEALGCKEEEKDGKSTWVIPNMSEMKKNTDICGF
jgi:hypothetical protein